LFKFCTLKGNEIFYIVEGMATAIREKERQNKQGGSCQGVTAPPISNVPRPTSLRKKFLQTQSKSFDSGAAMESDIAVKPMKKTGWGSMKKKNITAEDRKTSAPQLDSLYQLAVETSPGQNNNSECIYAQVGEKKRIVPSQVTEPVAAAYENVDTCPPVPPKFLDSPKVQASADVHATKMKMDKAGVPLDEADYADPDVLDEPAYAYACAEDIKRDLPWMTEPKPGEVKFQVEHPDFDVEYDY
jgi:hypothetical protein